MAGKCIGAAQRKPCHHGHSPHESESAAKAYILLILTDSHLGVLQQHADKAANDTIITELLKAAKKLEVKYLDEIEQRLIILANDDQEMLRAIDVKMEERIRQARRETIVTLFLFCWLHLRCVC